MLKYSSMTQYIIYFLISLILSLFFTPVVQRFAFRLRLVAYPRADRWHQKPTALLGGIAIYLSSIIPAFFIMPLNRMFLGFFIGATFLFLVGLADDKFHFAPYTKLFAQIIAGCIAVAFGVTLGIPMNNFLVVPLTLLWIIGVTNSFNLLDNIDGLAAGIAAISSIMLFISSLFFSNNPLAIFSLILCGATLGFLPYNFHPAKIFMGDSGSMFLGYSMAVISISGTSRHISNLLITMIIPVLILSVPIFDTLFVMIGRVFQGKKIFQGGKDHTSHRLVTLGLSQRKTVLLLYALSTVFGLVAISYSRLNIFIISVIAFLGAVILLFFGLFLFEVTSKKPNFDITQIKKPSNNTILNNFFMHKRRIVELLVDFVLICIAYYSAYFLRFEGEILSQNLLLIRESLIWIIAIKMSIFFIFGLYRGVWKYVSITELVTIFKAVTLSSIAAIFFLTYLFRFRDYSRAVFFMDWIILLFLVSGSRITYRLLGEFFSRFRQKGENILIYGAGDTGEMVMREIKRNRALNYNPIGFIDDDSFKLGAKIQGLRVIGNKDKIKELAQEHDIKEVLIAVPSININNFSEIVSICKKCNLSYRKIKGILDVEKEIVDEFNETENN